MRSVCWSQGEPRCGAQRSTANCAVALWKNSVNHHVLEGTTRRLDLKMAAMRYLLPCFFCPSCVGQSDRLAMVSSLSLRYVTVYSEGTLCRHLHWWTFKKGQCLWSNVFARDVTLIVFWLNRQALHCARENLQETTCVWVLQKIHLKNWQHPCLE